MSETKCKKCGAPLPPEAKFCGACGTSTGGGEAPKKVPPKPQPSMNQTLFMGSGMSPIKPPVKAANKAPPPAKPAPPPAKPAPSPPAGRAPSGGVPGKSPSEGSVTPGNVGAAPTMTASMEEIKRMSKQRPIATRQTGPEQPAAGSPPAPGAPSAPMSAPGAPPGAPAAPPPPAAPAPAPVPGQGHAVPGGARPSGPEQRLRTTGTLVGETLNERYKVEEKIGEGGFGSIYRAKQIQMGRDVALKVLNPSMTSDEKLVERFRREARSACDLRDPHTIITYDFDRTSDGLLYIAMELLRGKNLFEILETKEIFPPMKVASILEQCCPSLAEAHKAGIVHRDIKPENIVLEQRPENPNFVKILDFGIAKIVSGEQDQSAMVLTAAGQTLGTLEYMSPEQLKGKKLDGRSDIYALGILAYEMLTGDIPFEGDSPAQLIRGHLKQVPSPPSQAIPEAGVPPQLDRIVGKMLEKDRDQRYADVAQLRRDLQALLKGSSPPRPDEAPTVVDPPKAAGKSSKGGLWWKILLGLVALGAVGTGVTLAIIYLG